MKPSSLTQIESTLAALNIRLQSSQISAIERSILNGQKRELLAARWLIKQLFGSSNSQNLIPIVDDIQKFIPNIITSNQIQARIFDRITIKLQLSLDNLTSIPLEIDILRLDRKRELFYLILRQIEGLLDELKFSQVTIDQLSTKQSAILLDLWASVMTDFFGRYRTILIKDRQIEIVPILLESKSIIQAEILEKVPQTIELLNYLLFGVTLSIDNTDYTIDTQLAEDRAVQLLENLTINLANAVIQPLLDRFGDVESVKSFFYDRRLLSSREIERFRNDLSWRYRIDRYFIQPQAIFESRHQLFIITDLGIDRTAIYAPRPDELATLVGVPLAITIVLEVRDAISPRLKSATGFIGTLMVYLLTEIIGRGIGLVGRGVIKGIGNIWQETNRSRK